MKLETALYQGIKNYVFENITWILALIRMLH